jgi:hypothetical protein
MCRDETRPHRLHQKYTLAARQFDQRFGLRSVQREWLFAQDRFTGLKAGAHILGVQIVRCRHVHDIDVWIMRNALVCRMGVRDTKFLSEGVSRFLTAAADGHQLRIRHRLNVMR